MAADLRRFIQAALSVLALSLAVAPAHGQSAHSWLDPTLLAAAKAEGTLTVYSSTNEQEGLPLFKIFEEATGVKFDYIRGNDASLLSRVAIETRAPTSRRSTSSTFPTPTRCCRRCWPKSI